MGKWMNPGLWTTLYRAKVWEEELEAGPGRKEGFYFLIKDREFQSMFNVVEEESG